MNDEHDTNIGTQAPDQDAAPEQITVSEQSSIQAQTPTLQPPPNAPALPPEGQLQSPTPEPAPPAPAEAAPAPGPEPEPAAEAPAPVEPPVVIPAASAPPAAGQEAAPTPEPPPQPSAATPAPPEPSPQPTGAAPAPPEPFPQPSDATPAPQPGTESQQPADTTAEPPPPEAPPPPPKPAFYKVLGVKFRRAGKDYLFNSGTLRYNIGDQVIVETDRGLGLARVVTPIFELESEKAPADLKRVIRKANWNDLERDRKNKEREREALELCLSMIGQKNLNMKMVRVEYLHDASKAIFYFTAEQRVDFRDLVKDLARQLHTRIEMRQIGVRDEAKIVGGIGPCGRECCCATFLSDFSPVSVRMAKDQNLAMNPTKVSGLCGRLMCCLAYEHPLYHESCKGMPKKGKRMVSPSGPCRIIDLNILGRKALVELESGKTMFVAVSDLKTPDEAMAQQAQAEAADACAMDEAESLNDEILESDDPSLLEKMDKGRTGAPRPPDRGSRRDNGPSGQPRPAQQRDRNAPRNQQRPRPPDNRQGRQDRGRPAEPRPPAGAQPYRPSPDRPPAGAKPYQAPERGPGQDRPEPPTGGPQAQRPGPESEEQRKRRRRRHRHRK